jgi:outer membrane protein OmpA-like peptidoglycan-associated protein
MNNTRSISTRPTLPLRSTLAAAALAAIVAGCGSMAEPNAALTGAHASYRAMQADAQVDLLAPAESAQAGEAVRTADTAWTQRENARTVDHLAYLAQQRIAIARETANAKVWDQAAATSKAGAASDKARADREQSSREVASARRDTQDKTVELAVAQAGAQQDKSRASELEMQLKDLKARPTERGDVITLGDVQFDSNRARLRTGSLRDMDKLVDFMKRHPKRTAVIEGFTDSQGSEGANLDLSQRRAGAVRDALVEQGVPAERLTARGYGEERPVSPNDTALGRQMNRRVEIVLSGEDGTVMGR